MKNIQINKNPTTLVRVDREMVKLIKIKASREGETIKSLVEDALSELLAVDKEGKYGER